MQLIADPGFGKSFGIAFGAHIAGPRQISEHYVPTSCPVGVRSGLGGGGGRSLPLRGRPRLKFGLWCPLPAGLISPVSSGVPRSPCCHVRYVRPNDPSGCLGSAPRATAMAKRSRRTPRKPAKTSTRFGTSPSAASHISGVRLVGGQHLDQQAGGRNVEYGLRDKGPRQDGAPARRTPGKAMPAGQERLDPDHAQNADQLPVMSIQRAARRIVEPRQKFLLNVQPVGG